MKSDEICSKEPSALAGRHGGERNCPRCGAVFVCGMAAGQEKCWCAALPPAFPVPAAGTGCYCQPCLRQLLAGLTPPE